MDKARSEHVKRMYKKIVTTKHYVFLGKKDTEGILHWFHIWAPTLKEAKKVAKKQRLRVSTGRLFTKGCMAKMEKKFVIDTY